MSRNGSGVYSLAAGNPVTTGTTISSTWANNTLTDIASALTASIASDGQTVITANLPMSTYAHTGVGVATARTMYGSAGQIQDSTLTYLTTIAGADVITAVAPVLMSAYATGQQFHFIAVATNTTAVTVNINAIGAKSVKKTDGSALSAGDIINGATIQIVYDGTNFQFVNKATNSGDVVGPASATDNAVARFDATTGKLIQNSVVTIADTTGNMFGLGIVGTAATGALTMPSGTTAERPATPATGMIRYNSTLGVTEYYNGTAWYSVTSVGPTPTVEYLVVAGGGGGGGGTYHGGGGGAGGFRTATGLAVTAGSAITVTVGAGGAGGVNNNSGANGGDSVFGSITSLGGGTGGINTGSAPTTGGSGGGGDGGAVGARSGAAGTSGQGNAGGAGSGSASNYGSGGGGGASAVGGNGASTTGGAGGAGTASSISSSSVTYAGGGGGSTYNGGTAGAGGAGGGGAGSTAGNNQAGSGTANTGGGGGGAERNIYTTGGAGGSGIVIIRYADTFAAAASSTGSPTITVAGGYRVYKWTGSGSITF